MNGNGLPAGKGNNLDITGTGGKWSAGSPDAGYLVNTGSPDLSGAQGDARNLGSPASISLFVSAVPMETASAHSGNVFGISWDANNNNPFTCGGIFRNASTASLGYNWNDNTYHEIILSSVLTLGIPFTAALTVNKTATLATAYFNGTARNTSASVGTISYGTNPQILIARNITNNADCGVRVCFGAIWDRGLTADEVQWLHTEPYAFLQPFSRRLWVTRGAVTETQTLAGTLTSAGALTTSSLHKRLYFDSVAAAAAGPAFDGGWSSATGADRKRLNHVKQSSAVTVGAIRSWADAAGTKALDRQYLSAPLSGAQAISGTVKLQLAVREEANQDNVDQLWIALKVVSIDGGTVRGTLLSHGNYGPTLEFETGNNVHPGPIIVPRFRNKTGADGDALTLVNALDGDRILLEIGYSNNKAGTTPEARAMWGDVNADLPEDEATTLDELTGQSGWIEFSVSLLFRDATTQSLGGTATTAGNMIKLVGKIL